MRAKFIYAMRAMSTDFARRFPRRCLWLALLTVWGSAIAAPHPMTFDDLRQVQRVSEPQVSPDGTALVVVVGAVDYDANRVNTDLWLVPLGPDGLANGAPRQLTSSPKHERHPRWSPDGNWLAFESNRDGDFQIYALPRAGGEARKITSLATEATQPSWSPDGTHLAFVSSIYPEFSTRSPADALEANRVQLKAREDSKVKARVLTNLLYRHWDSWVDGRRPHVFWVDFTNGVAAGIPRNLTPGPRDGVPTSSTFSGGDEYDFSPDGTTLAHTAGPLPLREEAWRTDHEILAVDPRHPDVNPPSLTPTNPAADGLPRFSPDGKRLAYRAQRRAGYEADRWELWILDREQNRRRSLTENFDASVHSFDWSRDGQTLFFEADDRGSKAIWSVPSSGGEIRPLVQGAGNGELNLSHDGRWLYFTRSQMTRPAEVYRVATTGGPPVPVTRFNEARVADWQRSEPESVMVAGADGTPVQMWILKPPGFEPTRKYPLVFWVHGGPQSVFADAWSYRWNPQLWAAQGYVLALPNPRGSTGFGQKFTDEISHDWGGRVFVDLLACLKHLEQQPWVDTRRMAAAGGSFGGYMMNWFQGHTDKFKALVTHCGVYNFETMYGTTEELWFDEWEHGVPWENPDFSRDSPHRFASRFQTPNLIIHNELDFRVPVTQGTDLFTVLQRRGVPSKFLYFPDEGHWVLKPQNSELWHRTIFEWLAHYLKN